MHVSCSCFWASPGSQWSMVYFIQCVLVFTQEKERKARRRGKALQNEEASAPYTAEEEEMEGSGASGNEEEAAEDGEGTSRTRAAYIALNRTLCESKF